MLFRPRPPALPGNRIDDRHLDTLKCYFVSRFLLAPRATPDYAKTPSRRLYTALRALRKDYKVSSYLITESRLSSEKVKNEVIVRTIPISTDITLLPFLWISFYYVRLIYRFKIYVNAS